MTSIFSKKNSVEFFLFRSRKKRRWARFSQDLRNICSKKMWHPVISRVGRGVVPMEFLWCLWVQETCFVIFLTTMGRFPGSLNFFDRPMTLEFEAIILPPCPAGQKKWGSKKVTKLEDLHLSIIQLRYQDDS